MTASVTIVMVPRERYSAIISTINSIYENTEIPFKLVVVEGALPDSAKNEIEKLADVNEFEFIYKPYPLTPNEARNIGLEYVDTEYMVFSDDDIIFTPGWLSTLVDTAREYDAWLVGPTILDGALEEGRIHAAGGSSGFEDVKGKRYYHFSPGYGGQLLSDDIELKRGPITMLEFHVILCASHIFEKIGKLDEKTKSFGDHDLLVHAVTEVNGPVIFEPDSVVSYHDPGTNISVVEKADLPFFLLRWSDEWNLNAVDYMVKIWGLSDDDPWISASKNWAQLRRRRAYLRTGVSGRIIRFILYKVSMLIGSQVERVFYKIHTRKLRALRTKYLGNA